MINSWKTSAKEMLDHAGTYRDLVTLPGGLPWSGQTRDAAVTMAGRDYSAIDQVHDALDAMADAAATGMDPVLTKSLRRTRHQSVALSTDSTATPQCRNVLGDQTVDPLTEFALRHWFGMTECRVVYVVAVVFDSYPDEKLLLPVHTP